MYNCILAFSVNTVHVKYGDLFIWKRSNLENLKLTIKLLNSISLISNYIIIELYKFNLTQFRKFKSLQK